MIALALLFAVATVAETVATTERQFAVRYDDGSIERYVVRWTATADFNTREEGGPAEPLSGKFVDDRRCYWSTNGRIERQVFLAHRGGSLLEAPDKRRVYNTDFTNSGSSFNLSSFRSENCNDAADRRTSDFNNTRQHLRDALGRIAGQDFSAATSEYSGTDRSIITDPHRLDDLCYAGTWDEDVRGKFTWTFTIDNGELMIRRRDGFATGEFTRDSDGWLGTMRWGNGAVWPNVRLRNASPSCDEVRTNQVWFFKRY